MCLVQEIKSKTQNIQKSCDKRSLFIFIFIYIIFNARMQNQLAIWIIHSADDTPVIFFFIFIF